MDVLARRWHPICLVKFSLGYCFCLPLGLFHFPFFGCSAIQSNELSNSVIHCSPGGFGQKFQSYLGGVRDVGFAATCYAGDSIGTNSAVYKHIRRDLRILRAKAAEAAVLVCLFMRCSIQQYNIVRRAVVNKFDGHWANLVRLGHLFESAAFKKRLRGAWHRVLLDKFDYVRLVGPLPPDIMQRRSVLEAFLRRFKEGLSSNQIQRLLDMDNGPLASDRFLHVCAGCCASKMEAFEKMFFRILVHFD